MGGDTRTDSSLRRWMVKTLAGLALALTLIASHADALGNPPTSWRDEIKNGYIPYHRLTAFDFPVDDSVHPEHGMYTRGFRRYHFQDHCTEQNGRVIARVMKWSVWSGFDRNKSSRKSWFNRIEQTLPHEQGHLDISELHSRGFAETPMDKLPVGQGRTPQEAEIDLQRRLKAFAVVDAVQAQTEQDRYDAETNHGKNTIKQREWSADIQARLRRAGIHF